jgi:hypothetical protein
MFLKSPACIINGVSSRAYDSKVANVLGDLEMNLDVGVECVGKDLELLRIDATRMCSEHDSVQLHLEFS